MTLPAAICLAGRIGSGKTSLGTALADRLGCRIASFGAFVRAEAAARGFQDSDRTVLQSVGAELLEKHGPDWLTQHALEQAAWQLGQSVVVDGIRHVSVLESVRRAMAPQSAYLIYLQVSSHDLNERRTRRQDTAQPVEDHSTERQVLDGLPQLADLSLDGAWDVEDLVHAVISFVSK